MDTDKYLEIFASHLVALFLVTKFKDEPERTYVASGTLCEIDGHLIWITAGHNIEYIQNSLADPNVVLLGAALCDYFGTAPVSNVPVRISWEHSKKMFNVNSRIGLDIGAILIDPHLAGLIAKNKPVSLTERNWLGGEKNYFGYAVIGLPSELTSEYLDRDGTGKASVTLIHFTECDKIEINEYGNYRLRGALGTRDNLNSIEGMSGGPIFAFSPRNEGGLEYFIVGLQSSWLPDSRIIFGCPLDIAMPYVERWVNSGFR